MCNISVVLYLGQNTEITTRYTVTHITAKYSPWDRLSRLIRGVSKWMCPPYFWRERCSHRSAQRSPLRFVAVVWGTRGGWGRSDCEGTLFARLMHQRVTTSF